MSETRGYCWNCMLNVRVAKVDRSAEVGVYAIDELCVVCGEVVTEPKPEDLTEGD